MQLFRKRDSLDALEDLLDRERRVLLAGNYETLGRLLPEKERLLKIVVVSQPLASLARLKGKADRNQAMLLAAAKGIRYVTSSLAKLENRKSDLQTYDRTGSRKAASHDPNNLGRRV